MADSLEQLASKLRKLPREMKERDKRGLQARAKVTREFILAAASSRTKLVRPNWVQTRIIGSVAEVRLRGGFAYLTEKGSYKAPDGWVETPREVSNRRIRNAARKGLTVSQAKALNTPWGPKAAVIHPPLHAKPFWERGLTASRGPAKKAYERETVHSAINAVF